MLLRGMEYEPLERCSRARILRFYIPLARSTSMALNAYLKLKGQKQGDIQGSVTQTGQEGKIMVIAAEHEIVSPRDAASGQATGKRQHKPFVITKEIDKSSLKLYNALVANENLPEWELQFWAVSTPGQEVQRYTVKLTNARIADIKFHMPNTRNPDLAKYAEYEEVSFTYQKIQWIWTEGGITAQDDWRNMGG
jgi:type VI secretion system secreted protein Hcp